MPPPEAGAFGLPTERVPLPSVVGAVVPLQTPPPLPQAALHMPLTPTGTISLGRVPSKAVGVAIGSAERKCRRRHGAGVGAALPVVGASAGPRCPSTSTGRTRGGENSRSLAAVLLWMVFATILASEGIACIAAERLRADAATADERDVDGVMKRRMQLAGWTLFDAAVHVRTDPVIRDRLLSLADLVIANYRQEQPTVGRAEWEQAHGWLTRAVTLYPENKIVLARLRYTEGHLQRLTGQKRAEESGQAKQARQSYYAAVQKFREAAALDPKTPDPYLGLTHTYVYGLGDVDNAVDSLNNAEKRGYKLNRRERAQLGDAYRARGERVWRTARGLEGDQKRDAFERAHKDFKRCVEYFAPIVEFANAADQLQKCEARVAELDEQITPWWKRLFGDDPIGGRVGRAGVATAVRVGRHAASGRIAMKLIPPSLRPRAVSGDDAAPVDARRLHAARFRHGRRRGPLAIRARASSPLPVPIDLVVIFGRAAAHAARPQHRARGPARDDAGGLLRRAADLLRADRAAGAGRGAAGARGDRQPEWRPLREGADARAGSGAAGYFRSRLRRARAVPPRVDARRRRPSARPRRRARLRESRSGARARDARAGRRCASAPRTARSRSRC